jgi:hypothetical protein
MTNLQINRNHVYFSINMTVFAARQGAAIQADWADFHFDLTPHETQRFCSEANEKINGHNWFEVFEIFDL